MNLNINTYFNNIFAKLVGYFLENDCVQDAYLQVSYYMYMQDVEEEEKKTEAKKWLFREGFFRNYMSIYH